MILALDASNKTPFIALIDSLNVLDIERLDGNIPLSKTLYPGLDAILQRNNLLPYDIKKVLYGRGPGSFLGTRTAANLASALYCSLKIEVKSFISPLAYLPFEKGKFAYFMRPKGGRYPVLLGVKEGENSAIFSTHLLLELKDFFTSQTQAFLNAEHLVLDPAIYSEMQEEWIPSSCVLHRAQVDPLFLPTLDLIAIRQEEEVAQNRFGLIY